MIYLDNAATTKVDNAVVEVMKRYFLDDYGNAGSMHQFGKKADAALGKARKVIAAKINASPGEIVFTSGGTEGNNLAIKGTVTKEMNHIVTTTTEHKSILEVCGELDSHGYSSTIVSVDKEGFVSVKDIEKAITDKTALVSVIHGNNEIGTLNNIAAIGKMCRSRGVLFHVDACQSFLKHDIDVAAMNIDLLTINAHKVHGPKGVGALYVRKGVVLRPLFHGGRQEFGVRPGTENVAGIVGFGTIVSSWAKEDNDTVCAMRRALIDGLLGIDGVTLNGPVERLCTNVNVRFSGVEGDVLVQHLSLAGIYVSTGSACTSQEMIPSHVLKAIGLSDEEAFGSVRFSLSKFNTLDEIEEVVGHVKRIVGELRKV